MLTVTQVCSHKVYNHHIKYLLCISLQGTVFQIASMVFVFTESVIVLESGLESVAIIVGFILMMSYNYNVASWSVCVHSYCFEHNSFLITLPSKAVCYPPDGCGSHGVCVAPNHCDCNANYEGARCEIFTGTCTCK